LSLHAPADRHQTEATDEVADDGEPEPSQPVGKLVTIVTDHSRVRLAKEACLATTAVTGTRKFSVKSSLGHRQRDEADRERKSGQEGAMERRWFP